ncbi:MAG: hypothetical protein SGJ21_16765 [Alphaproteobacteria bacterium]|nr:hypothetical protein [Alphaproteobacteria bacterium]
MPLQNRVDPLSRIHRHPARGLFTGNRGALHHEGGWLVSQRWRTDAWIICTLTFKDRKRVPMAPRGYTHLFFLDEATALAAGHRPCFECRREDARAYCDAIARWTGVRPDAPTINRAIREEMSAMIRFGEREAVDASLLPAGAMFTLDDAAWLVLAEGVRRWSFEGYGRLEAFPVALVRRLTPRMSIAALEGGYDAQLAPSAMI